jgi:hypothetical protein
LVPAEVKLTGCPQRVPKSINVFSNTLTTGIIIINQAKYNAVLIWPKIINGSSTWQAPNFIKIKKLTVNTQKKNLLIGLNWNPLDLPRSENGSINKAKIAAIMDTTPKILLGIDLNIA